jgi:hypothetical protein
MTATKIDATPSTTPMVTSSAGTPTSTSAASTAPTSTTPPPPTYTSMGYMELDPQTDSGATYFVKLGIIRRVSIVDNGNRASMIGVPMKIATADDQASAVLDADEFSISHDNTILNHEFADAADAVYVKTACSGSPMLQLAAKKVGLLEDQDIEGDDIGVYDMPPGTGPFDACLVFETDTPNETVSDLFFQPEGDVDESNPTAEESIWHGTPKTAGKASTRQVLDTFSGSGSRLISVPKKDRDGGRTCWDMYGSGNHILEEEDDTAGTDEVLLTNSLGSEDKGCTTSHLSRYIQVIAEGSWTITVTNF